VVTGASGGLGRATAVAFTARGDRVALLARGRAGLAAAADDVQRAGGEAFVVTVDMADAKAVEAAAQQVTDAFGPIDVWVDNAFGGIFAPFTEINHSGRVPAGGRRGERRAAPRGPATVPAADLNRSPSWRT
jgi:short-subunit dehydrogenase